MGVPILIQGGVQPKKAGFDISLERFTLGTWNPFGEKIQTDANGNYSLSVTESTRTPARYRVIMGGDEKIVGQVSSTFTVVIY